MPVKKKEVSLARYVSLKYDDDGTIYVQTGPKLFGKSIKGGKLSLKRMIGKWN